MGGGRFVKTLGYPLKKKNSRWKKKTAGIHPGETSPPATRLHDVGAGNTFAKLNASISRGNPVHKR